MCYCLFPHESLGLSVWFRNAYMNLTLFVKDGIKYVNVFIHTIKMGISSKREKETLTKLFHASKEIRK